MLAGLVRRAGALARAMAAAALALARWRLERHRSIFYVCTADLYSATTTVTPCAVSSRPSAHDPPMIHDATTHP
jgi:hypothetical protein